MHFVAGTRIFCNSHDIYNRLIHLTKSVFVFLTVRHHSFLADKTAFWDLDDKLILLFATDREKTRNSSLVFLPFFKGLTASN